MWVKIRITQRKLNGFYIFGTIGIVTMVWILLLYYNQTINQRFESVGLNIQIPMHQINYIYSIIIPSLILPTMIIWSIRNKVWQGKRAIRRFFLTLSLRKEMLDANYHDERHITERVARIPKIKIEFNSKEMTSGKLMIRDSVEFHERLSKATFTPALKGFLVENAYHSNSGDYWIYSFISTELLDPSKFDTLNDYLNWAKKTANKYQLRIDDRFSHDLKHTLLVGATRSGKTYGLIGLLQQMLNKPIDYELFFADPKNDQLRKIGDWINPQSTAFKTEKLIELVHKVYCRLEEREEEMKKATSHRMTGDYRDVDLKPIFLIFDEFSSFINVLDTKKKNIVLGELKAIVQRGASAGVFLFLKMQKSDTTTLPTAIRSNLLLKIVLGNAPTTTYTTAFESSADIPAFNFRQGQGVLLDDTMTVPMLVSFPYLRFLEEYNNGSKKPASLWKS